MIKCNITNCNYFDNKDKGENNCKLLFNLRDCEKYQANNTIQLIPIKNETFDNEYSFLKKINEEVSEFKMSIHNYELSKAYKREMHFELNTDSLRENIIEEFHDVIQSMLQLMIYEGITVEEIIKGQDEHFNKLVKRGWKL